MSDMFISRPTIVDVGMKNHTEPLTHLLDQKVLCQDVLGRPIILCNRHLQL